MGITDTVTVTVGVTAMVTVWVSRSGFEERCRLTRRVICTGDLLRVIVTGTLRACIYITGNLRSSGLECLSSIFILTTPGVSSKGSG